MTKTYSREEGCISQALNNLHWPTLQHRRQISRLCMRYKTLNNEAEITAPTYVQHQQFQRTRHSHPRKFTQLQATCDAYNLSVWPRTIKDWKSLHVDIIQSNSIPHLFQARLRRAYLRGGLFNLEQTMVSVLPEKPQVSEGWSSCSRGSESIPNFQLGNKPFQISPRLESTVMIYQYSL